MNPLVTIAIPTFNRAVWLKGCVMAALDQSYQNFEVVVSDNASTDDTPSMLRGFNDQRLRVLRQKKKLGPIQNWNACLAVAKGEFIVFVSDDDRITPWLLERCIKVGRNEPQIPAIIALGDRYFFELRHTQPERISRNLGTGIYDGIEIILEFLKGRISPETCTVMFQTRALRANGGFPPDWPQTGDIASWISLLFTGKAGLVNERCGTACTHGTTQSCGFPYTVTLNDLRKLVGLVNTSAQTIEDPQKRQELRLQAKHFLTRHALGIIAAGRKGGAKLAELLPVIWIWRGDLLRMGIGDARTVITLGGLLLIPQPLLLMLRKHIQMRRRVKSSGARQRKEYEEVHKAF